MRAALALPLLAALCACGPRASGTPAPAQPAGAPAPAPAKAADPIAALAGSWRVTKVGLAPGPVQALSEDDPAYMGAVLDISPARLAWRPHEGGTLSDVCEGPKLEGGAIRCASGSFGPDGARTDFADGRLHLEWYDNARLVLARDR